MQLASDTPLPCIFSSAQVREHCKDEKLKMKTRVVNIDADEGSCPTSAFASTFRALMVVSDQMESKVSPEGKAERVPVSRFAKQSTLWFRRRCRAHFNMLPSTKFVDPVTENAGTFRLRDDRMQFNAEKRSKQYLAGESFWGCILESLFQGTMLDKSTHCAIVDLTPYDATLQKHIVLCNHLPAGGVGLPTMMTVQPSWYAATDAEKDAIKRYVQDELKQFMIAETQKGSIRYASIDALAKDPPSLQSVPVLDESKFFHSKPDLEMEVCRLKQDFVNKWSEVSVCRDEFALLAKLWNEVRNKGGEAWKGNKGIASVAHVSEETEEAAIQHVPDDTDPKTLAEAQVKNGAPVIIPNKDGMYDHVFFPDTGAYALHIKQDTVISDHDYLVLIKGSFETGETAKTIKEENKMSCLPWAGATSMNDMYSFTHDLKGKTFPKKPSSLMSFIAFLETNSKVKVSLLMHKMSKDKTTKDWAVNPDKECLFVVKPIDIAKKEKPSDQNAGSYVKVQNAIDNPKIGAFMRWRFCGPGSLGNPCERPINFAVHRKGSLGLEGPLTNRV